MITPKRIQQFKEWHQRNPGKQAEYQKRWDAKNKQRRATYAKEWYEKNKDLCLAKKRRYKDRHPDRVKISARATQLRTRYNLTLEEYDFLVQQQKGVCAICRKPDPSGMRLAVDHCHKTNKVRGLLCCKCNRGLGNFDDDPGLLRDAALYLLEF